jgi:hypothetical protein
MKPISDVWNTMRAFYEARHEPESMRPLAEWYWRTLLMTSLVLLCAILVYGTMSFFTVLRTLSEGDTLRRDPPPEILNKKQLSDFLSAYAQREQAFESAKQSATSIGDPSR